LRRARIFRHARQDIFKKFEFSFNSPLLLEKI